MTHGPYSLGQCSDLFCPCGWNKKGARFCSFWGPQRREASLTVCPQPCSTVLGIGRQLTFLQGKGLHVDNDHPSSWSTPSISSQSCFNDVNTLILTVEPCDFRLSSDKVNVCTLGRSCFLSSHWDYEPPLYGRSTRFAITFLQKVLINI